MSLSFGNQKLIKKYLHNYNVILDNMDMEEYRLRPISAIMYVQDAFARYCATKKMAAYDLFPKNLLWVLGEFNIEFTKLMPFWSEEIRVEIWISEISKLKVYTDFAIYNKTDIFAKGCGCWFLLNQQTKRPVKTDIVSENFELCSELAVGNHKKISLIEIKEEVGRIVHKNSLSDIDFNNHVNNKSYINIAEATVSQEFKKHHSLKKLYIKFCKESFIDDILTCITYRTMLPNTFAHILKCEETTICEIQTSWTEKYSDSNILNYNLDIK